MKPRKISTILFDFDGTIADTNEVILASWQATYRHYHGEEKPVEWITSSFGEPLLVTLAREFPELSVEEVAAYYRSYQKEHTDHLVKLFPGIDILLEELKKEGYHMAIVTSRTRESTNRYLTMLGIGEYFQTVISCDDTDKHKPDPEPIYLCLERLQQQGILIEKKQTVMVGDSLFDIKCANDAGVISILVEWRLASNKEGAMEGTRPNHTIGEPMELLEILERL